MIKICPVLQFNNIQLDNHKKSVFNLNKTKKGDTVSFSGGVFNTRFKVGNYIENIGLVLKRVMVFNKKTARAENCYIVYQNTESDGVIRLIKNDTGKIISLSKLLTSNPAALDLLKQYGFRTPQKVLNGIKEINAECYKLFNDLIISEIAYTTLTREKGKQRLLDAGYKCIEGSDIVAIEHFITKQKNYQGASRFVASPLLQALRRNGDKNIIIRALAIGENSSSPVDLYLKSGFIPIKRTVQDIDSHRIATSKGKKVDPKYEVSMFLPQDAHIYKLVDRFNYTDEICKIMPNWFKRIKIES